MLRSRRRTGAYVQAQKARFGLIQNGRRFIAMTIACNDASLTMKVYLDDLRPAPEGWHRTLWPDEVIALLESGGVTHLSLDHDLGDDTRGTGYDVVRWIEEAVVTRNFVPPEIAIHSANPVGRERMARGILALQKAFREK